jgi:hypothetical protein
MFHEVHFTSQQFERCQKAFNILPKKRQLGKEYVLMNRTDSYYLVPRVIDEKLKHVKYFLRTSLMAHVCSELERSFIQFDINLDDNYINLNVYPF